MMLGWAGAEFLFWRLWRQPLSSLYALDQQVSQFLPIADKELWALLSEDPGGDVVVVDQLLRACP